MRAQALGNVSIFETWDGGLIHIGTQLHRVANVKGATRVKIANPTGQQRLQPVPIIAESE